MRIRYFLMPSWIIATVWLLYSGLVAPAPVDVKDLHVGMSIWMLVLTFPLGLLVFFGSDVATAPFGQYFGVAWAHHPEFYCFIWACFFLVGILQWLVLVPWLTKKLGGVKHVST